jgi:hypothetical protein
MPELSEQLLAMLPQIENLENKAKSFDDAVERVVDLAPIIESFEQGELSAKGLVIHVKRLVEFYEPSSKSFISKIKSQGYQENKAKKYTDSTFNDEKIIAIRAYANGEVFASLSCGLSLIGTMSDDCNYTASIDTILCDVQYNSNLKLIK